MENVKAISQNDATIIVITHELDIAAYCSRKIRIEDGRIL